jgi:hypothetical protein
MGKRLSAGFLDRVKPRHFGLSSPFTTRETSRKVVVENARVVTGDELKGAKFEKGLDDHDHSKIRLIIVLTHRCLLCFSIPARYRIATEGQKELEKRATLGHDGRE